MSLRAGILCVAAIASMLTATPSCSRVSLPSLEEASCREARDSARRFYSLHFGSSLAPSAEELKKIEAFLTSELFKKLEAGAGGAEDYFTATSDYPKAFRVGRCTVESDDRVRFDVRLFWRDDTRSEEKGVDATLVRLDGKWLIDEVSAGK